MNPNGPKAFILGMQGKVRLEANGVIDHQQRFSHVGFMVTWPFCFHVWIFWKLQEVRNDPHYSNPLFVPGTESGFYARTPGWRYDADLGMKWTWGYVGGNWD